MAKRATCSSNLKQIGIALFSYTNDYNSWFPPPWSTWDYDNFHSYPSSNKTMRNILESDYLKDYRVYYCPNYRLVKKPNVSATGGYWYWIGNKYFSHPNKTIKKITDTGNNCIMQDVCSDLTGEESIPGAINYVCINPNSLTQGCSTHCFGSIKSVQGANCFFTDGRIEWKNKKSMRFPWGNYMNADGRGWWCPVYNQ